ncbi:MAG: hypothetical protein KatS3mg027_0198 [Bacteroidia bacterium]|nr:MAG: hypothetical protein KatS3mg027_0198 [Bacteroidia bacterium]
MNQFEIPQNLESMENIIKVIGVGGGGSNAVKYLYNLNVKNVDFIVCNTDKQHLESSPIPNKIQLGKNLTKGLGAGCIPEKGREAAIESKEEIKRILENKTEMLFITAGLGGGTGTGAAPIIAEVARSLNVLTVAIVTLPFHFEGKKKMIYAEKGLEELKKHVDSIIVIPNEKLKTIYPGMKMSEAFAKADDVVSTAAKSIAEIITNNLHINVDFNDVRTVMQNSGTALMGTAIARGENRALEALKNAINHPLLANNTIEGAKHILLSITTGTEDLTTDEFEAITNYIEEASGGTADVIPGYGNDSSLGDAVSITIVATGFSTNSSEEIKENNEKIFTTVTKVETVALNENVVNQEEKEDIQKNETPAIDNRVNEEETLRIETIEASSETKEENEFKPFVNESQSKTLFDTVATNNTDEINNPSTENIAASTVPPLDLPESSFDNPPVVKIVEKDSYSESPSSASNTLEQLSENIKSISEKTSHLRKQLMDLNNPIVFQELESKPAYLRKKESEDQKGTIPPNHLMNDHSNYTVDENGNIRPNNPYLNDQVD